MIRLGNFLFHYRNAIFPVAYVLIFLNGPPIFADYRLAAVAGFVVAFAGQLLRAVTIGLEYIIRGGRKRQVYADKLVQGGIFAHCRNPLYVGNFMILLGVALASNSLAFLCIAMPVFALAYWAIIAAEENYLRTKFGGEYDDYCARVNRLVPNFSGMLKTISGMHFNWRRLITKEYGSTFIWMAGLILVTLKNAWFSGNYGSHRPLIWSLWGVFIVVTLAYGTARFLKKTKVLRAEA